MADRQRAPGRPAAVGLIPQAWRIVQNGLSSFVGFQRGTD
jgi:hypothetical protein